MNPTFNLIDEPWIPVIDLHGRQSDMSLQQTLLQAHMLRCIAAPNPHETAAILRLLLAILHRTHDTASKQAWEAIWKQGQFDEHSLCAYLKNWEHRFDLFDPHRPFFQQHSGRSNLSPKQIHELYPGIIAARHFNRMALDEKTFFTPAQAARGLLVSQSFGTGIGVNPAEKLAIRASTWCFGQIFFIEGDTLFQTLAYNLLRYDEYSPLEELARSEVDRPNWEAEDPYLPRTLPLGYLDYLTWPSRRLLLLPEQEDGQVVVRQFTDFLGISPPDIKDPFKFYVANRRAQSDSPALFPVKLIPERALWRNSGAILRLHQTGAIPPRALEWLADLKRIHSLRNPRARLVAYGMVADKTKVFLLREERIPLPLAYLDQSADPEHQDDLVARLERNVQLAERIGSVLKDCIFHLAQEITPGIKSAENNHPDKLSKEEKRRIQQVEKCISALDHFWAELERPFSQMAIDLAEGDDPGSVEQNWLEVLLSAGRNALTKSVNRAGQYPKALKAGVLARGMFERRLAALNSSAVVHPSQGEENDETNL